MIRADKSSNNENGENPNDYFSRKPSFEKKGPSQIKQKLASATTVFIAIAAGIVFYFAFLRMPSIVEALNKIVVVLKPILYGLGIAFLLNPIVIIVDNHLRPYLCEKFGDSDKKKQRIFKISRITGIFTALAIMMFIIITLLNMIIP